MGGLGGGGGGGGEWVWGGVAEGFEDAAGAVGLRRGEEVGGGDEGAHAVVIGLAVTLDAVEEGGCVYEPGAGFDELEVDEGSLHRGAGVLYFGGKGKWRLGGGGFLSENLINRDFG